MFIIIEFNNNKFWHWTESQNHPELGILGLRICSYGQKVTYNIDL